MRATRIWSSTNSIQQSVAFASSHSIMRASTRSFANFSSTLLTVNARLNTSDSNSMSWKLSASARRVKRFSGSIEVGGQWAVTP
ncbi:MAG: hypothetical protein ACXWYQ_05885, partial [Actinomycetota bacterium]